MERPAAGSFAVSGAHALALSLLLGACSVARHDDVEDDITLPDLQGTPQHPLEVRDSTAHVLFFITTDCPIANSYAPEIRSIVADHATDPLRFFVVHVDPDVTRERAAEHKADFDLPGPVLLDTQHRLVRRAGITITPEVAVILPGGAIAYRGRIDNQWGDLGSKRPRASRHDLRDALRAVLAGHQVAEPRTEAIGCDVPVL